MKIKSVVVTINRSQGKPLVYSINPLTIGPEKFALVRGVVAGVVESDRLRIKYEEIERRQARLRSRR